MPAKNSTAKNERWKDVVGWEGIYQVSDLGRVKRVSKPDIGKSHTNPRFGLPNPDGYLCIQLSERPRRERRFVHRLVLEAFAGHQQNGVESNHKNGVKKDNRLDNLEWVTHKENMQHAAHVLNRTFGRVRRGEENNFTKLTESQVRTIRNIAACGISQQAIAYLFDCSQSNISLIVSRTNWAHLSA